MPSDRVARGRRWFGGALGTVLLLAGAGLAGTPPLAAAGIPHGGTLTYIDAPLTPFVKNFNPFSPSYAPGSAELQLFEPLLYFDSYTEKVIPVLATSYRYSRGDRVITMTLRRGVKWSDGVSFTSADVVFTYEDILKHPAIDLTGVGSDLKSVSAEGPYKVRFVLKQRDIPFLYYLAGLVPILPKHIWQGKNPVTFTNPNPVTTGPFLLEKITSDEMVLKRNPDYWNRPLPYVSQIDVPMYLSNTTSDLAMSQGKWSMGQQFIPDIHTALLAHNPSHYFYWFPPVAPTTLFTNDAVYPTSLPAFRQALSVAINRNTISSVGEYGYEPPINGTGLPLPTFAKWVDPKVVAHYPDSYSPARAKEILRKAGFKWSPAGKLLTPKGQPVTLTLMAPSGATDYVADSEIMVRELQAIGINATATTPSVSTELADLGDGHFQLAILWTSTGPGPYFVYDTLYNSVYSAPVGKVAPSNYERWMNPETDRLLNAYAHTNDPAKEHAIMDQLEAIVASQLPTIPLVGEVAWDEYNTTQFVGWPTAADPYSAFASEWDYQYIFARVHER